MLLLCFTSSYSTGLCVTLLYYHGLRDTQAFLEERMRGLVEESSLSREIFFRHALFFYATARERKSLQSEFSDSGKKLPFSRHLSKRREKRSDFFLFRSFHCSSRIEYERVLNLTKYLKAINTFESSSHRLSDQQIIDQQQTPFTSPDSPSTLERLQAY